VLLAALIGLLAADWVAVGLDVGYWAAVVIVTLTVTVGLPVLLVVILLLLFLIRNRRFRSEDYEFGRVRKLADTEGAVVSIETARAWVAEPDDHPPLLHQALEAARTQFQALLPGASAAMDVPLRIICFENKRHLEAYGEIFGLWLEALDGLYLHGVPRRIVAVVEVVPRRPLDPSRILRMLFGYYFLTRFKGFLLPTWLGVGVVCLIANAGDRGELARINRKVLALLARTGIPDKQELFCSGARQSVALLRAWRGFEGYIRFSRALHCARSIAEYLGGGLASELSSGQDRPRIERFRDFLQDLGKADAPEVVFERHLGHSLDVLLDDWRQAVETLGPGEHEPPPAHIREALLNRVIPLLEDPRAEPWEKIRAIRDMGSAGYVLGADALIRTLEDGEEDVAREAALALEWISGIAAGEDVRRWWEWWHELPSAAVPVRDTAIRTKPATEPR